MNESGIFTATKFFRDTKHQSSWSANRQASRVATIRLRAQLFRLLVSQAIWIDLDFPRGPYCTCSRESFLQMRRVLGDDRRCHAAVAGVHQDCAR